MPIAYRERDTSFRYLRRKIRNPAYLQPIFYFRRTNKCFSFNFVRRVDIRARMCILLHLYWLCLILYLSLKKHSFDIKGVRLIALTIK